MIDTGDPLQAPGSSLWAAAIRLFAVTGGPDRNRVNWSAPAIVKRIVDWAEKSTSYISFAADGNKSK